MLSGEFLGLDEEETESCFTMGMYYAQPVKLANSARTIETTAELCQQRCQVVEECTQFTFWPDSWRERRRSWMSQEVSKWLVNGL